MLVEAFRRMLWYLILGTRGGLTRARIISALRERPMNINQLAERLGMDYKTVRHHIDVLSKHRLVISAGERYSVTYFLSPELELNYAVFEEIWEKIREKVKEAKATGSGGDGAWR